MTNYAVFVIRSKKLREQMKKNMLIYNPELADSFYHATETVARSVRALFAYVSMHECAFVYSLENNEGARSCPLKTGVLIASLFSGVIHKKFNDIDPCGFSISPYMNQQKDGVISIIKRIEKRARKISLVLAGIKQNHGEKWESLSNGEIRMLLLNKGIIYEDLPEIFKRGICIEFNNKNESQSIISLKPSKFADGFISKYETLKSQEG